MLCVTHDIAETQNFDRVLVVENGRVCENGAPSELRRKPRSRYRALLDAEAEVRQQLWTGIEWRRISLHAGRITEARSPE